MLSLLLYINCTLSNFAKGKKEKKFEKNVLRIQNLNVKLNEVFIASRLNSVKCWKQTKERNKKNLFSSKKISKIKWIQNFCFGLF
jgi:hypothetical protein